MGVNHFAANAQIGGVNGREKAGCGKWPSDLPEKQQKGASKTEVLAPPITSALREWQLTAEAGAAAAALPLICQPLVIHVRHFEEGVGGT
jgi:hypothetical protein